MVEDGRPVFRTPPLPRGLDKSVCYPHQCELLFLDFTIQNVYGTGKRRQIGGTLKCFDNV